MTIRARSKTFAVSLITAIGVGIGCIPALHAQEKYPSRPIRFLIPFPPGGAADIIGRTIGEKISARLGQPVVMDNRPGAGGAVATAILAKSEPDGYTILVGLAGPIAISPWLVKLPYQPDRDLLPITRVSETLDVMVVPTASGIGSVKEFIDWAKRNPGNVRDGSSGIGQFDHLAAELFQRLAGVQLTVVTYKGGGPALIDLVSGQLQVAFCTYIVAAPHLQSRKLRVLAVVTPERQPLLPGVPTVGETVPGFGLSNWNGIFAPAHTPAPVVDRIFAEVSRALTAPDLKEKQNALGIEPVGSASPKEFSQFVRSETAKWGKIVHDANIKLD